jgi:hypothetical protein
LEQTYYFPTIKKLQFGEQAFFQARSRAFPGAWLEKRPLNFRANSTSKALSGAIRREKTSFFSSVA